MMTQSRINANKSSVSSVRNYVKMVTTSVWMSIAAQLLLSLSTTTVEAFAVVSNHQGHRRASSILTTRTHRNSQVQQQASQLQSTTQEDDWELADGIKEPVPTTIEIFLKKKFPEFYYLAKNNEDVLKVIRDDGASGQAVTYFAPNSKAFENLGPKRLQQLDDERNLETTQKIASYHVVTTEALTSQRLFTEDWTKGRPKDGGKPAFTIEGVQTMGGIVPVGRSKKSSVGNFISNLIGGTVDKAGGEGEPVLGTNDAKIVRSYYVGSDRKIIVHEMDAFISPQLLWRYVDQLRIPGF